MIGLQAARIVAAALSVTALASSDLEAASAGRHISIGTTQMSGKPQAPVAFDVGTLTMVASLNP